MIQKCFTLQLKNLMKKKFKKINIPRFDKSSDERFSKKNWQKITNEGQT